MEKINEILKSNKSAIGISAALLALGGAALYFLTRKGDSEVAEDTKQGNEGGQTSQGAVNESSYVAKARAIANNIRVAKVGNTYDLNTISQVLEQSIELAEADFISVTLKNRQERREHMQTDVAAYEKLIVEYNDEVENVLKKAQQQILEILNVPYEDFEESVIDFMEKGHYQEIYMFQAAIRQKIKEKIKATQDLSIEKTKEIIRFQIEILNQQPELLKQLISKLSKSPETVQLIPIIITNLLNDYIYNQFKVEEEDQMKVFVRPDLASDSEIILLLQEIEQSMFSLMMPFGSGMEGAF